MVEKFYGRFQSEHKFSKKVFEDNAHRREVLRRLGYEMDMASNRTALYDNADIVAQLGRCGRKSSPQTNLAREWLGHGLSSRYFRSNC